MPPISPASAAFPGSSQPRGSSARSRVNGLTAERHVLGAVVSHVALVLAASFATGCSETPSLTVQLDAPDGAKVDVEVSGPASFKKVINTTTTFENVPAGRYAVRLVESRKRITRDFIDDVFLGTVEDPEPTVDAPTTVRIRFDREPGSGHVWVPVAGEDKVMAFGAAALAQRGKPTYELQTPQGSGPDAVAFRLGDMWVAFRHSGQVASYDAMTLAVPGEAPRPVKTIQGLGRPTGLAFDKSGDLFVSESSKRIVSRFTGLGTSPTRTTTLPVEGEPGAIAFDSDGAMYLTTTDPPAVRIFTFDAEPGSRPLLRGSIRGPHTGLVAPGGLAFDADGTLWVANGEQAPAVRFEAHVVLSITGDVDAVPLVSLAPPTGETFNGLAFDKSGQGWFSASAAADHRLRCGVDMQTKAPTTGEALSLGLQQPSALALGLLAFNPPPVPSPIRR